MSPSKDEFKLEKEGDGEERTGKEVEGREGGKGGKGERERFGEKEGERKVHEVFNDRACAFHLFIIIFYVLQ